MKPASGSLHGVTNPSGGQVLENNRKNGEYRAEQYAVEGLFSGRVKRNEPYQSALLWSGGLVATVGSSSTGLTVSSSLLPYLQADDGRK